MSGDEHMAAVEKALAENVRLGLVELFGMTENGDVTFRLTERGKKKAAQLLAESPDNQGEP